MSQQPYDIHTMTKTGLVICTLMNDSEAKKKEVVTNLDKEYCELCRSKQANRGNRDDWNEYIKKLGMRAIAILFNTNDKTKRSCLIDIQNWLCCLVFCCIRQKITFLEFFDQSVLDLLNTSVANLAIQKLIDTYKQFLWIWLQKYEFKSMNYVAVIQDIENLNNTIHEQMAQQAQQDFDLNAIWTETNTCLLLNTLLNDEIAKKNKVVAQNVRKLQDEYNELRRVKQTNHGHQDRNDCNDHMEDLGMRVTAMHVNTISRKEHLPLLESQSNLLLLVSIILQTVEINSPDLLSINIDKFVKYPVIHNGIILYRQIILHRLRGNYDLVNTYTGDFIELIRPMSYAVLQQIKQLGDFMEVMGPMGYTVRQQMKQQAQQAPEPPPVDQQDSDLTLSLT